MAYKILGVIFIILVCLAFASVVYYVQIINQPIPDALNHIIQNKIYNNDEFRIFLTYDKSYELDESNAAENYFRTNGISLAKISLPQNSYPNTNFSSGYAVLAVRDQTAAENCSYYLVSEGSADQMTETITISGMSAYTTEFSGAAAGTKYDTKLYHIPYNNICYEIHLTLAVANIGNFATGMVREVDENQAWARLDQILMNFKLK